MVIVAGFQTDLGRVVTRALLVHEDRMLKILYNIAMSPANDGKIGARLDTLYLGMIGLTYAATRDLVRRFLQRRWIARTSRNEYRLTEAGLREVLRRASPEVLLRS